MHAHVWDADLTLSLLLANGVTGVPNTGGRPESLQPWRKDIAAGLRLGPDLVACGPVLDGDPPRHPDHSVVVHNAAEARTPHIRFAGHVPLSVTAIEASRIPAVDLEGMRCFSRRPGRLPP